MFILFLFPLLLGLLSLPLRIGQDTCHLLLMLLLLLQQPHFILLHLFSNDLILLGVLGLNLRHSLPVLLFGLLPDLFCLLLPVFHFFLKFLHLQPRLLLFLLLPLLGFFFSPLHGLEVPLSILLLSLLSSNLFLLPSLKILLTSFLLSLLLPNKVIL